MATNSRLGISVNLPTGATYDLLLVNTANYPEGKLSFEFLDTPRKITGIQKVAQLFLKILFTTKGSDVLNINLGTRFPDLAVNANRVDNESELSAALSSEILDAERQCQSILNTTTTDDASQLDRVTILGINTSTDSIILYLRLLTVAGETAQVAIPFPQLDLSLAQE